jgi:hypothetical protein
MRRQTISFIVLPERLIPTKSRRTEVANYLTVIHECKDYPIWKKGI